MQRPVEEIVLLSTSQANKPPNENEAFLNLQTTISSRHYKSDEDHQNLLKRLIKPTNRTNFYQNLLLWIILFSCFFLLAAPLALHLSYALPAVKPRTIPLYEFSEERARDFYPNLTQYGPRVTNTQADYLTRDFLISRIYQIRSMVRTSVQFEMNLQNFSVTDVGQLQNIAVRLSNSNSSLNTPCLMLVAHYDSVEFSLGGSDDGAGVVILLELLLNLVNDPLITFSQVHLIVLFTAGEEMGFSGAEAFVENHQWKDDVRRFINIDSTGGNEKAILFRMKPSQLVNDYKRVPRPHANVIGDEISDHITSDTDYSVFTSKGFLLGYDFAFYLDGYNYHTSLDTPSIVEQGALQHLGENTLVLCRHILLGEVNLAQPETITDEEDIIYFDILGRHLVTYKQNTSIIIQSILIGLVVSIGLLVIILDHVWYRRNSSINDFSSIYFYFENPLLLRILFIVIFLLCYLFSMIFGIFFPIVIAFVISKFRPLSWYGNSTLAVFLYGLPSLTGVILCESLWAYLRRLFLSKYPKKNPMEMNTIDHINRLCFDFERHWALLLIIVWLMSMSIYLGYRSLYFILLWSIFICPIYLLLILLEFSFRWSKKKFVRLFNEQGWYWLFAPYIVSLVPLIHTLEMTSRLTRIMIPMMGRMLHSTLLPQDILICLIIVIPAVPFFLLFIPNSQRIMNYRRTLILLTISFLIVFLIACLRQPFTITHPKIIRVTHESHSNYKLINPTNAPITVPISSQTATITMESFDNLILSPTLDQYSRKIGYSLHNRSCSTPTKCSFDDSFNRTLPFIQVELTSMDTRNHWQFIVRHLPSYQITVSGSSSINVNFDKTETKLKTETIIDVDWLTVSSFAVQLKIERCDLNDSPFLLSLTRILPYIVLWGDGRCQALVDILHLSVSKYDS